MAHRLRSRVALPLLLCALLHIAPRCSAGTAGAFHPDDLPGASDLLAAAGSSYPASSCSAYSVGSSMLEFICNGDTGRLETITVSVGSLVMPTIPASIGTLTELVRLSLTVAFSQPGVTLPRSIFGLAKLELLYFEGVPGVAGTYALSGSLPEALGALTALQLLSITKTTMTGRIPESVSQLQALTYLDLSNNLFTGFLTEALCAPPLAQISLGNNAFMGGLASCMPGGAGLQNGGVVLEGNFLAWDFWGSKLGSMVRNCYGTYYDATSPQKTTEQCAQFCGLPKSNPPASWFSRACVPTNPRDLFKNGVWDIGNIVFKRQLKRTCAKSAGPCGVGNCKAVGGWCRAKKTLCCCNAGKDPVYDLAGNVIGCTLRTAVATVIRDRNLD